MIIAYTDGRTKSAPFVYPILHHCPASVAGQACFALACDSLSITHVFAEPHILTFHQVLINCK